ncbi:MAG: signal peptidase II [Clostridia bacterium]|nr:signal peptidase II [Clostridia bacterium]
MTIFKKKTPKDYIIYSAIIVVGIILDQLTKFLTVEFMTKGQSIPLIKGFLHLTYTTNDGMAFGAMDGADQRWIFMLISTLMIIGFTVYLYLGHADNLLYGVSMSMVVSGGIGNMIDRLGFGFYVNPVTGNGEVIDFIDFCGIWNAVFNGADSFVCVGAGLLMLALVLDIIKESKAEKAKKLAEASGVSDEAAENTESKENER